MLERALNDLLNPKSKTNYLQILATFKGSDGSMGFSKDTRYEIIVRLNRDRGVFEVRTSDGRLYCPYSSVSSFTKNWTASAIQKGA